ncbi:MAG TPA: DUF4440 domain-containing protein [Longimicrobiales bacterium]|nr:DUF4440 domain-containing protein [Longimicrobiales bacterium]
MRRIIALAGLLCAGPLSAQEASADARELLRLHEELLVAHRTADVDRWMRIEAADYVSANGGRVTHPEAGARRAGRAAYLAATTFEVYRDLQEPLVRISEDGSLGWLIAEVEVRGTTTSTSGDPEPFHDVWAWVELYRKVDGRWVLEGNASNRRPGAGG